MEPAPILHIFIHIIIFQVHYPSDPQQPGPIYFLTPRKCAIFGICCDGIPRQVDANCEKPHSTHMFSLYCRSIISLMRLPTQERGQMPLLVCCTIFSPPTAWEKPRFTSMQIIVQDRTRTDTSWSTLCGGCWLGLTKT